MSNFDSNLSEIINQQNWGSIIDLSGLNTGASLDDSIGIQLEPVFYLYSAEIGVSNDVVELDVAVDWYANNQYVDSGFINYWIDTNGDNKPDKFSKVG